MRHLTFDELRQLIDFSKIDSEFLAQGFRLAGEGSGRPNMIWTSMENLEKDATKYAFDNGFDPATMLVLYDRPKTEEEKREIEEQNKQKIEDWDDIQIGYTDPNQITASVYKNMTTERFIKLLLKPWEMRVFS